MSVHEVTSPAGQEPERPAAPGAAMELVAVAVMVLLLILAVAAISHPPAENVFSNVSFGLGE